MTTLGSFVKTNRETKRYSIDYSAWLDVNETVVNCTYDVMPTITLTDSSGHKIIDVPAVVSGNIIDPTNFTGTIFYVSGGTIDQKYRIRMLMITSASQVKDDEIFVQITQYP